MIVEIIGLGISWQKAYEHYDIYKDQNWDFLKPIKQENVIETVVESSGGSKGITLPIPSLSDIDFNQVGRVLEQLTNLVGMAKDVLSKSPSSDSLEKKIFERYKD